MDELVDTRDLVLYCARLSELFKVPLLTPAQAVRIAERQGASDGRALVQELRDEGWAQVDPQGRIRVTTKGLEDRADGLAACRADHERRSLATQAKAREQFLSLFAGSR